MRLSDAFLRFLSQLAADGRSPQTIAQYRRHLTALVRWLGAETAVETVTPEILAAFLTAPATLMRLDGSKKLATSVNALRTSVKVFFAFLARAGIVPQDPARLIRRARCAPAPPRTLTAEEVSQLLTTLSKATDRAGTRDSALFHTLAATGMRLGSVLGLDAADLDLASDVLIVRRVKGNRPMQVPITPALRQHLTGFVGRSEHGPLFRGPGGKVLTPRHVQRRLSQWLQKAGIRTPASPHTLRHSFATRLYEKSGDVLLVQKALGHASPVTSAIYAKASDERLRAVMTEMAPGPEMRESLMQKSVAPEAPPE